MDWVLLQIKEGSSFHAVPPSQQPPPYTVFPPPPPQPQARSMVSSNNGFAFNVNRVSPSILLIIIILAVIFFISGLLHLLVRFLLRPQNRDFDQTDDDVTVLQGQLQQLFHLHDAGVDQSFIDTLPVFSYKSIIGVKDPFDCAVCLCEFEGDDKLRLLPKCSHAFHMECIDTWLLSHSTCPLCRASLLSDFSPRGHCSSPIVLVLESGSDSSREIVVSENTNTIARVNSHFSTRRDVDFVPGLGENESQKPGEIQENCDNDEARVKKGRERVVSVKLGKFRTIDSGNNGEGSTSDDTSNNAYARRCFSMGSFAYVMDETSSLQVPIRTPAKKQSTKKPCLLPLTPTHKPAMSECSFDSSRREISGFDEFKVVEIRTEDSNNKHISSRKRESLSFSKIWLRGKKDRIHSSDIESSRRAVSFRFPALSTRDESKIRNSRRTISEIGINRWEDCGIDDNGVGLYDEDMIHSCDNLDSEENNNPAVSAPSFARRTLHWLMGKQNSKVVHSTFSGNV